MRARSADRGNAIELINSKPFGKLALLIIAIGLVGYAAWRVISGFFYGGFAYEIVRLLMHHGAGSGSDQTSRHWAARAMDRSFGRWAVAAAGLAILGYGGYQIYRAVSSKVRDHLDPRISDALVAISRFGIAARALIFGVIGVSLVRAAILFNANAARGTSGAVRQFSGWLLPVVAFGLIAYGVYAFINARYRRIRVLRPAGAARSR